MIKFRKALCNECESCILECTAKALTLNPEGIILIDVKKCDNCLKCIDTCPTRALYQVAQ